METQSEMLVQLPQFFKVVMFPNDLGLKIPVAFMRKYGSELQEVVLLKVPTGASWQVGLVHNENRSLLKKGWQEFAEFYSIEIGHFLVFRYEGNSHFHVLIFDPTGLEVEYPSEVNSEIRSGSLISQTFGESGSIPCVGGEINVEGKEILKAYQTNLTSEGKSAQMVDVEDDASIQIIDHLSECKSKMSLRTRSSGRLTENIHTKSTKAVEKEEISAKFKSYQEAKSSRPFFISLMQRSHVSHTFRMDIPKNFLKEHLSIKKDCNFMLHVSRNIRKWPVLLRLSRKTGRVKIRDGFSKFVKDNNLKVGDVCVFELGESRREFNVTVYPSAEPEHEMVA